jgi:uracil-DNA glycosylase
MGFFAASSWSAKNSRPQLAQCGACGLSRKCFSPRMPPTGKGSNKVLVVAEAPGEEEDRQGVQLIGRAGQLLRNMLHTIGEELDDCWKTNAVICRPPGNEIKTEYVAACRPTLLKTIAELKPRVIILLGGSAVESVIEPEWGRNVGGIGRWAGYTIPSPTYNAWLCPTYHPSYLLRPKRTPCSCCIPRPT